MRRLAERRERDDDLEDLLWELGRPPKTGLALYRSPRTGVPTLLGG